MKTFDVEKNVFCQNGSYVNLDIFLACFNRVYYCAIIGHTQFFLRSLCIVTSFLY